MSQIRYNIPQTYSFSEFIKMHSTINNIFIDDFFNQFNEENINTYDDFIIDLDQLRKWPSGAR